MLPTGGVAGVSVFASKVFENFALAATADVFVSTSLSEGTPMIFSKEKFFRSVGKQCRSRNGIVISLSKRV